MLQRRPWPGRVTHVRGAQRPPGVLADGTRLAVRAVDGAAHGAPQLVQRPVRVPAPIAEP